MAPKKRRPDACHRPSPGMGRRAMRRDAVVPCRYPRRHRLHSDTCKGYANVERWSAVRVRYFTCRDFFSAFRVQSSTRREFFSAFRVQSSTRRAFFSVFRVQDSTRKAFSLAIRVQSPVGGILNSESARLFARRLARRARRIRLFARCLTLGTRHSRVCPRVRSSEPGARLVRRRRRSCALHQNRADARPLSRPSRQSRAGPLPRA